MTGKNMLVQKVRRIKMVMLDVDGVMTDGGIYYSADGVEMKRFHAHDGFGIVRARESGLKVGIISGRKTAVVTARARELHIKEVIQGTSDKLAAMRKVMKRLSLRPANIAFMGDDLFDLPLLGMVGLSGAPANARAEVKRKVDVVTDAAGGNGAVREFIEFILQYQRL